MSIISKKTKASGGIILAVFVLSLISLNFLAFADSITDLQNKINESNNKKVALEKEIALYQGQIKDIQGQASSLQNTIKTLTATRNKLLAEIKLTQNNIDETTLTIKELSYDIGEKNSQIKTNSGIIGSTIRQINEKDQVSAVEAILANENISEFLDDVQNIAKIQNLIKEQVDSYKIAKSGLESSKTKTEKKKAELLSYNQELANQKKILDATKKEQDNLLATTKNKEANYKKILAEKLALKEAFDNELARYESQLKLAIDPNSIPHAGSGVLAWPLDKITITQKFGTNSFAKTAYASGMHNGVDFAASIGTKVKSAGNGVVEGVGDTDIVCAGASFGKWVFIRYDNGLASIYGHLSLITAIPGQRIATGESVGYSGNTGYSTGPHLHMTVYASQGVKISTMKSAVCRGTYTLPMADTKAYLDPLLYL
ncbi:MAG: peptidoglycan DD-metalloendopeptidase family protein [bacterium]